MDSLGHEFSFPAELCITGMLQFVTVEWRQFVSYFEV
jgi:hypothetical protein